MPGQSSLSMYSRREFQLAGLMVLAIGVVWCSHSAIAAEKEMSGHEHHHHPAPSTAENPSAIKRSETAYILPALKLTRQDGAKVDFNKEINDGRPVILNFIYTSCTAICPISSQIFSQVHKQLEKEQSKVRMVSISIDPEYDTPSRLSAYAKKFGASSQWQFYTGTLEASIAVQKAFDAYRGDKMNHLPLTLLRAEPGKPWVRLDGFASPETVIREYQNLSKGA